MSAELLESFYKAFQQKDGEAMAACYAPDATFSDPVFPGLTGAEPGWMWRMLCARGKDLEVVYSGIEADGDQGKAHWEATYTFSATGNKVHNIIDAAFTFRDGKIATHVDTFDLKRWCGMALGFKGKLLGGTGFMQNAIRKQARSGLDAYISKHG